MNFPENSVTMQLDSFAPKTLLHSRLINVINGVVSDDLGNPNVVLFRLYMYKHTRVTGIF